MKKRESCLKSNSESCFESVGEAIAPSGKDANELVRSEGWTYLTTDELSSKIKYDPRTIRDCLKDSVLLEGIHYIRPFGGRKILFIWERIEADMGRSATSMHAIPMANGGVCHG